MSLWFGPPSTLHLNRGAWVIRKTIMLPQYHINNIMFGAIIGHPFSGCIEIGVSQTRNNLNSLKKSHKKTAKEGTKGPNGNIEYNGQWAGETTRELSLLLTSQWLERGRIQSFLAPCIPWCCPHQKRWLDPTVNFQITSWQYKLTMQVHTLIQIVDAIETYCNNNEDWLWHLQAPQMSYCKCLDLEEFPTSPKWHSLMLSEYSNSVVQFMCGQTWSATKWLLGIPSK